MKVIITGACGFLGSNLCAHLIESGHEVLAIDNFFRTGSRQNLTWLQSVGQFRFEECDTRNGALITQLVGEFKPDCVFHFAGQVAMTTSIQNPMLDFEINVQGALNVLEAVRLQSPQSVIFYSSTNKVYGDLTKVQVVEDKMRYRAPDFPRGFSEDLPLSFQSPYGCSKGAVDQYMLDYDRIYGVRTVVFRHSSIFGGRQFPTFDQAWVGWFAQQALIQSKDPNSAPFTIAGDGKQVRDILFAEDIIQCYMAALAAISNCHGRAFNIGGGMKNSLSLLELFEILKMEVDVNLRYTPVEWRPSDQRIFVADYSRATEAFGWKPQVDYRQGIRALLSWLQTI